MKTIVVEIDGRRFALDLAEVEQVVQAVEIVPLGHGSQHILGAINLHGTIMPILSLRHLLHMTPKDIDLTDNFLICKNGEKKVGLWIDQVCGLTEYAQADLSPAKDVFADADGIEHVISDQGEVVIFLSLEKLLKECIDEKH
jgi:purine-binding chemotaxis protein CheW